MELAIQKFIDFKLEILNEILSQGEKGVYESVVFKSLNNGVASVYNFKEGLTPDKLITSLIMDGYIMKVCDSEYYECKYVASDLLLSTLAPHSHKNGIKKNGATNHHAKKVDEAL